MANQDRTSYFGGRNFLPQFTGGPVYEAFVVGVPAGTPLAAGNPLGAATALAYVRAHPDNLTRVNLGGVVGGSTTVSMPLDPGEWFPFPLPVTDLRRWAVFNAANDGGGVNVTAVGEA